MMTNRFLIVLLVAAVAGCMDEAMTPHAEEEMEGPAMDESGRVLDGLQVLYRFDEGSGLDVKDVSGVAPAFDLKLDNLVTQSWIPGGGIEITGTSVITSLEVAEKVFVNCVQANAVSLEVWVEPANIDQQGTIFTYSKQNQRNATLSVNTTIYAGQVLTSREDPMMPGQIIEDIETIQTPQNLAKPTLQHIVFTRDATGSAIYLNGGDTKPSTTQPTTPTMPPPVMDQNEWSPTYQLALGNESTGGSPWLGKIYLAAVYCKKLSLIEANQNYTAGH